MCGSVVFLMLYTTLANPYFKYESDYVPYCEYDSNCLWQYCDLMSGN